MATKVAQILCGAALVVLSPVLARAEQLPPEAHVQVGVAPLFQLVFNNQVLQIERGRVAPAFGAAVSVDVRIKPSLRLIGAIDAPWPFRFDYRHPSGRFGSWLRQRDTTLTGLVAMRIGTQGPATDLWLHIGAGMRLAELDETNFSQLDLQQPLRQHRTVYHSRHPVFVTGVEQRTRVGERIWITLSVKGAWADRSTRASEHGIGWFTLLPGAGVLIGL